MPAAFFTRTQVGALISPLNNHVTGTQRALTGASDRAFRTWSPW
jgi:hypothetical protein